MTTKSICYISLTYTNTCGEPNIEIENNVYPF